MPVLTEGLTSSIKEIHTLNCLSEVDRLKQFLKKERTPQNPPYEFKLNELPEWTNEELEFDGQNVNLFNLTCNCKNHLSKRKLFPKNDLRIICTHIYESIITSKKYLKLFDEFALLLMKSVITENEKLLVAFNKKNDKPTFYIGGNDDQSSYNIYIKQKDKWTKYIYSIKNKKWANNNLPNHFKLITETINRNKFVFDNFLCEVK